MVSWDFELCFTLWFHQTWREKALFVGDLNQLKPLSSSRFLVSSNMAGKSPNQIELLGKSLISIVTFPARHVWLQEGKETRRTLWVQFRSNAIPAPSGIGLQKHDDTSRKPPCAMVKRWHLPLIWHGEWTWPSRKFVSFRANSTVIFQFAMLVY